jgi:hypothetical protein
MPDCPNTLKFERNAWEYQKDASRQYKLYLVDEVNVTFAEYYLGFGNVTGQVAVDEEPLMYHQRIGKCVCM